MNDNTLRICLQGIFLMTDNRYLKQSNIVDLCLFQK